MSGMTLAQMARHRFLDLVAANLAIRTEIRQHGLTTERGTELIRIGLALHIAKGDVPKRLWPLTNRVPGKEG